MSYRSSTYESVQAILASRREKAEAEAEKRRIRAESEIPRLREIREALQASGQKMLLAALRGSNRENDFRSLKEESLRLRQERAALLKSHGYPEDFLSPPYTCPICRDTGRTDRGICLCMKRELVRKECDISGLGVLLNTQRFDTFDLSLYPPEDRPGMEKNLSILKEYADSFKGAGDPSFLLIGGTGLGKTHLSSSVARVVIERGFSVGYIQAQSLISAFGREGEGRGEDLLGSDLLIVDDLGTEYRSEYSVSILYMVINTRMTSGKPVIINTNLNADELRRRYEDRITSRLFGEYRLLLFRGKDIRQIKLTQTKKGGS